MSLNNAHEGYQYQDVLCSYFILQEVILGHFDSVLTFDKKHIEDDRFDDLVIQNGDNIQRKQIKYSNETSAKHLSKDDLSNDNGASLAIYKLFENWQVLRTDQTEFRLCLAWNEPIEANIKDALIPQSGYSSFNHFSTNVFKLDINNIWQETPENFNRWDNLKKYVKQHNIDRTEFVNFCNELLIETNFPKASLDFTHPDELESILIEQAKKIGIGQYPNNDISINDFLIKIVKFSGDFRTNSTQLSVKQILEKLRIKTDFGQIEQKFQINQEKNIIFKEKIETLLQDFRKNQKSILVAEPGAGKSWFLTNLIEYLKNNNQKVLRHYCFTGMEDSFYEQRVTSDVFFGNLIADIQSLYPNLQSQKEQIFASNLNELNLLLSKISEPLIIIIDGLDHIERVRGQSKTLSEEKTRIIDCISKIETPDNVSIILGSQPVNEIDTLIQNHHFLRVDLPKWNADDILSLVNKFNIDVQTHNLTQTLLDKSQGNPLYLNYILNHLKDNPNIDIQNDFPDYDFNLKSYYEFLSSKLDKNTKSQTLDILCCLEFSVTREELSKIHPLPYCLDEDLQILSPVLFENLSRGGISLYHDSFRRYQLEKLGKASIYCYKIIGDWLNKEGFYDNPKSYRYLFKYLFNSERYSEISNYAKPDFLVNSLYYGYPEKLIRGNSLYFLYVAQELEDWGLLSFLSEFNRTIYSTNSEEYHSQFIENFEIYFESVLNIYGYDRANSLLFFNNEMNFDIVTTAKAFSILTRNGYKPDWEKIDDLFKDSISEENFEYFLYSQIDNEEELLKILNKSLKNGYENFFDICISFLFRNNHLSIIDSFVQELDNNTKDNICFKINKISLLKGGEFYIPINIELEKLSIDFLKNSDYIDGIKTADFYFWVSLYAKYDINNLIEFEKSIDSQNFFYNWIKFFIRTFIIEETVNPENIEKDMIENIEFLCSDVKLFTGRPRAIDLKTSNNEHLVELSVIKSLKHISSKENWKYVLEMLIKIPVPIIGIIGKYFSNKDSINFIIDAYHKLEENQELHYYEYAECYFQKALIYSKKQYIEQAKNELRNATLYITNYTFRKDVTLSEMVDPIDAIHKLDADLALDYTKKLKYLTDAVGKHTEDGKGIKWIAMDWFKHLSNIDYYLSGKYLICEFIKDPYFWKLDYMLVDFLAISQKIVNPIILNFLYKLSPTNNREEYLNDFLNVINSIKVANHNLAKLSLISLLNRDWNDSYEKLSNQTMDSFESICQEFNLIFKINKDRDQDYKYNTELADFNNKSLNFCDNSLNIEDASVYDIIEYYDKKEYILDGDFKLLHSYLMNCHNECVVKNIISSLIKKKFPRDYDTYFENLFILIQRLNLSQDLKINLLALNTLYSKDGWMNMCVYKEPLKLAVEMDYDLAKNEIFRHLCEHLKLDSYRTLPIANLVTAFEFCGIEKEVIFDLYNNAYTYIESRLPDTNDFDWSLVESNQFLSGMNADELAVTLMLAKMKNLDSTIQREALFAIHYLINYETNLLIKPIKWFFENLIEFNQLSIVAVLELIYLKKDKLIILIEQCKDDLKKCQKIGNFYIDSLVDKIIEGV